MPAVSDALATRFDPLRSRNPRQLSPSAIGRNLRRYRRLARESRLYTLVPIFLSASQSRLLLKGFYGVYFVRIAATRTVDVQDREEKRDSSAFRFSDREE